MQVTTTVDASKRTTLKGLTTLSASGLVASLPAAAIAGLREKQSARHAASADLAGALVRRPHGPGDTLVLRNITARDISITHFHANRLVFDGDIVDCNDACVNAHIDIAAGTEVSVRVRPQRSNYLNSPAGEFLDVDSYTDRLPEGVRIVPLLVHMKDRGAILSEGVLPEPG